MSTNARFHGKVCQNCKPLISGDIDIDGARAGIVTAGVPSPYLGHGIGIALMDAHLHGTGTKIQRRCADSQVHPGELVELPMYDKEAEIPRGRKIDIPDRT